jgi:hypothetical protein
MLRDRIGAAMIAVVLCCSRNVSGQQTALPTAVATINYDEFMRLDFNARRERFSHLSHESRAMIVRTHAERWLAENRDRLSRSEIAVFQEAIAFVTPDMSEKPLDPQEMKKYEDLKAVLRCRVDPRDVMAAFRVLRPPDGTATEGRWTYLKQARCWIYWFVDGMLDYVPRIPR